MMHEMGSPVCDPLQVTPDQWKHLLTMKTPAERKRFYRHLFNVNTKQSFKKVIIEFELESVFTMSIFFIDFADRTRGKTGAKSSNTGSQSEQARAKCTHCLRTDREHPVPEDSQRNYAKVSTLEVKTDLTRNVEHLISICRFSGLWKRNNWANRKSSSTVPMTI